MIKAFKEQQQAVQEIHELRNQLNFDHVSQDQQTELQLQKALNYIAAYWHGLVFQSKLPK